MAKLKKSVKAPKKARKSAKIVSFKVCKEKTPFMTLKFTEQTFYWLVMLSLIFCLSLWVLSIQLKTTEILQNLSAIF